jgi:hypothetical protein
MQRGKGKRTSLVKIRGQRKLNSKRTTKAIKHWAAVNSEVTVTYLPGREPEQHN